MSSPAAVASCVVRRSIWSETHLDEMIGDHVPHAPALVADHVAHRLAEVGLALVVVERLGDGDERVDDEEADGILVVVGELAEDGHELGDEEVLGQRLAEPAKLLGGRAPDHGRLVGAERRERAPELVLGAGGRLGVARGVERRRRRARGEPVARREPLDDRHVELLDLARRQVPAHLVQRLGGLSLISPARPPPPSPSAPSPAPTSPRPPPGSPTVPTGRARAHRRRRTGRARRARRRWRARPRPRRRATR